MGATARLSAVVLLVGALSSCVPSAAQQNDSGARACALVRQTVGKTQATQIALLDQALPFAAAAAGPTGVHAGSNNPRWGPVEFDIGGATAAAQELAKPSPAHDAEFDADTYDEEFAFVEWLRGAYHDCVAAHAITGVATAGSRGVQALFPLPAKPAAFERPSLSQRIMRVVPHGSLPEDSDDQCDDEANMDVAGAHPPRGCHTAADVIFGPDEDGLITVSRFAGKRELNYQSGLEVRYMRQYDGLRSDAPVPGLANSRFIVTGSAGNLSEIIFTRNNDLVRLWFSTDRALTLAQNASSVQLAHKIDAVVKVG